MKWGEYRLGDLFIKKTIKGVPKNEENLKPNKDGYHMFGQNIKYQYSQKIKLDYKYLQEVDSNYPILAYTSSVGEIGLIKESFYRSGDNGAFQGMFPKNYKFNFKELQFIESIIKKQFDFFGYGTGMSNIMELKISLPTREWQIDFEFINDFVAELEADRVAELEAYLMATGLSDYHLTNQEKQVLEDFENNKFEWKEFRIWELFEKPNLKFLKSKFDKEKDVSKEKSLEFDLPLVNAKNGDNGIMYYGRSKDFESIEMSIDIVGDGAVSTGNVYFQPQKTGILYNAYLIKPKFEVNKKLLQFFTSTIQKSIKLKFGYENKAGWAKVNEENIQMPIKNSQPDYEIMEIFISAIQKLVIKDVVIYADRKIAATKDIINKNS